MSSVDDEPYRILHLADPHFTNCHFTGSPAESGRRHAAEVIEQLEDHDKLSRKLDVMVLSGDFTFRCAENGFDAAVAFIEALAPYVAQNGLLVIPGNHDIKLGQSTTVGKLWLPMSKEKSEEAYLKFLKAIGGYVCSPNPFLSVIAKSSRGTGPSLFVAGLNSCRVERRDAQGWGYVGMDQISQVAHAILEHGAKDEDIVVAVMHHNLLPIWDLGLEVLGNVPGQRKFSFTMDAGAVLGSVADLGVSVLLHGHTHVQSVKRVAGYGSESQTQREATLILGAGTLGLAANREDAPRHFQLIEVHSTELRYWDFTCLYHVPDSRRYWRVSAMNRAMLASWKTRHAEDVLNNYDRQSNICAYDAEVMNSWSALHDWETDRDKIVSGLTGRLSKSGGLDGFETRATEDVVGSIIEEIVSQGGDEYEMSNWPLEQCIIGRIGEKRQSWSVLPAASTLSSSALRKLALSLLPTVLQSESRATRGAVEKALGRILGAYPSYLDRCKLSITEYVALLIKNPAQ